MNNLEFTLTDGSRFFYLNPNVMVVEQRGGKASVTDTNLGSSKTVKETYEELRVKAGFPGSITHRPNTTGNPSFIPNGYTTKQGGGPL